MKIQVLTNAKSLATRQRFRAKQVDAALEAHSRQWGNAVKTRAVQLSRGKLSKARLRSYRPGLYSTERGEQMPFDAYVNVNTGRFTASWRVMVFTYSGHITVTVLNASPEARWMQGTRLMRERPILKVAARPYPFSAGAAAAKRKAEASAGGSLVMELIHVGYGVASAYGGAAMEG